MLLAELFLCQQRESSVSEEIEILTERATTLPGNKTGGNSPGVSRAQQHKENCLERELDSLLEEKTRVQNAQFRWSQAAIMLDFAVEQLHEAVRHWQNWAVSRTEEEK